MVAPWRLDDGNYVCAKSDQSRKTPAEIVALWKDWLREYREIWSIEDGVARTKSNTILRS